jgi:hypothetical protein
MTSKINNLYTPSLANNTALPSSVMLTGGTTFASSSIAAAWNHDVNVTDSLQSQFKIVQKSMKEFMDFLEYKGVFTAQEFNDFIDSRRVLEKLSETKNS